MDASVNEWVVRGETDEVLAGETQEVERHEGEQPELDWKGVHEELLRVARARAGLDWEEAHWLVRAARSGTHLRFGYGSIAEYVERLFGYTPRWTAEKLRVAEELEGLPEIAQALRDGVVSWSAVRELTRVATAETEGEWLQVSRGRTVREIEAFVSGQRRGNRPGDPPDPAQRRHVLRFEVTAEAYALFREAQGKVRRDAGGRIDDDTMLLSIARQILGGPTDEGRSSYQVVLNVCDRCKRAEQHGRGELVEVGAEIAEMAACDAQCVDLRETHTDSATHVGGGATHGPKHPAPRATQSIPPAIRRLVVRRDHGRCVVSGCRHGTWLDVHHIDLRSEGGNHDPDKLILLCGVHHRAQHAGFLSIEGSVATGLRFRHADGTEYGGAASPPAIDARAKAFAALRNLGFRETDVKRALERIATHVGVDARVEALVRQALVVLTA